MTLAGQQEGRGCVEVVDEAAEDSAGVSVLLEHLHLSQQDCSVANYYRDGEVQPEDVELFPQVGGGEHNTDNPIISFFFHF